MKLIFMGTPDFAAVSLKKLIEKGYEILAVFTQTDKPKGRGNKLAFSPVKELALEQSIPIYQPKTLKDGQYDEIIREYAPDAIAVAAYGKILPRSILDIPPLGCVNLHGSLLPKYRGAAPIQRSVLNGDKITGVTTMLMADGIDTGDMLEKVEAEIGENETAGELFDRLAEIGAELFAHTLGELAENRLTPQKQNEAEATYAPMLSKAEGVIDFSKPAEQVHNLIRGLSDWPCAVAYLNGKRLKIYKSEITTPPSSEEFECGEIIDTKNFIVACGNKTAVKLTSVQYDGSKRMGGCEFLRGRRTEVGEKLTSE